MGPEPGVPLDLRKLRYFVAVAEELHFGRAAARLYIAQPVLSRQIRKLEQELGSDLLERTSRNVALTPAGARLLEEARTLLAAADAARRRMHDLAQGEARLAVGFFIGDEFTSPMRAFSAQYPDVEIDLLRVYWHDQTDVLLDGRADVVFVHLPVDGQGLELLFVRSEPRFAVLPVSHAAAGKDTISIAELGDDPVIIQRGASPGWQAFHNVDPRPDGRQPRPGPAVDNLEEKLQHVAAGRAISFVPASTAASVVHAGIVYVPVADIPPIKICLAWKSGARSPLIAAFVDVVKSKRVSLLRGRRASDEPSA
jgi:DNA-binding transcriptional LysR family regulator